MKKLSILGALNAVVPFTIVAGTMLYMQGAFEDIGLPGIVILGIAWIGCVLAIIRYLKSHGQRFL